MEDQKQEETVEVSEEDNYNSFDELGLMPTAQDFQEVFDFDIGL